MDFDVSNSFTWDLGCPCPLNCAIFKPRKKSTFQVVLHGYLGQLVKSEQKQKFPHSTYSTIDLQQRLAQVSAYPGETTQRFQSLDHSHPSYAATQLQEFQQQMTSYVSEIQVELPGFDHGMNGKIP